MLELQLFWVVSYIATSIIETMSLKYLMDTFSTKKNKEVVILSMAGCMILITTMLNIMDINMNIKLAIGILNGLILYLYNYKENIFKVLIITSMFWLGILGMDMLAVNLMIIIHEIVDINEIYVNSLYYVELIVLAKVLLILMVNIIRKIKLLFNKRLYISRRDIIFISIPIVANIINTVVMYSFRIGLMDNYKFRDKILMGSSILSAVSNLALIFIIVKVIKESELRIENKAIKEKIEYQHNHYIQLQNAQSKVRQLYHDMNNHLICIENMNKHNEESKEYIESIKSELNEWKLINTTGNMTLDIILNEKKSTCLNNNIDFNADINFRNCDFIEMIDVCTIFANILDNAIEACNKIETEEKYIKIAGNTINKFFVIRCENSKNNNIFQKQNKIFTDKKDKFLHGLGINNIKDSVEKYNGSVSIDYTEEKFIINIYVPLSRSSEARQGGLNNETVYSNM